MPGPPDAFGGGGGGGGRKPCCWLIAAPPEDQRTNHGLVYFWAVVELRRFDAERCGAVERKVDE